MLLLKCVYHLADQTSTHRLLCGEFGRIPTLRYHLIDNRRKFTSIFWITQSTSRTIGL